MIVAARYSRCRSRSTTAPSSPRELSTSGPTVEASSSLSPAGKDQARTGDIESFNGRLRDECLNTHQFLSIDDAKRRIEAWRHDYKITVGRTAPSVI